ncbi:MAG: recombinase family protein [Firmicutes bacterium]|nr:recombinase family protein [Bacillota bacterium]
MTYKNSVAVYLRKSRQDPDDESIEETLARHEGILMETAKRQNLIVTAVYKEVVSGDGLFTRPEMVRLLQDIENDKFTAVLCVAIDRLGRSSQKDGGIILETFQEHNVFIITPQKTYDLSDEIDEQSVEMQSFLARQELKSIKRRLQAGTRASVADGYHICEPPYGYRRAYVDKHPTLEIYEDEAKVIRMVFDMYVNQGLGSQLIADTLNSMGYKPRKNDRFSRTTIRFYLQNPTYAGKIVWNRRRHIKKKLPTDKHKTVPNSEDKWIVADGIHKAIIPQELFDAAQEIRLTRTHPPSFTGELKNPFAGLIYCKNCGFAMQRQFSKKSGDRMLCATKGCNRSVGTKYIEDYVLNSIRQTLKDCTSAVENNVQSETQKQAEMIRTNIKDIKKELTSLNNQKSTLHDLLEKGVYDIPTFLERGNILNDKLQSAEKILKEKQEQLTDIETAPPIKEAIPIMEQLLTEYETLSPYEKNTLYKRLFKRLTYTRTKTQKNNTFTLNIEWRYIL